MTAIAFIAGMITGGTLGVVVMAICAVSGRCASEERGRADAEGWIP